MREVLQAAPIYYFEYDINQIYINKLKIIDFNKDYSIEDLEQENNDNDFIL